MTRNLKILGLALMAVCALSALGASSASAAGEQFHCEVQPCTITATEIASHTNKFIVPNANVACPGSDYHATMTLKTETSVTVTPKYTNCKDQSGNAVTVDMNGCDFRITSSTGATHAQVHVECLKSTERIVVTDPGLNCNLKFGPQTPEKGSVFKNTGAGTTRDIDLTITATGITYEKEGGFLCSLVGNGKDGEYNSELTVEGFEDLAPNNAEGAQVGLWWE